VIAMYTDPHDVAEQDQAVTPAPPPPTAPPTAAERSAADHEIRSRALCDHGGYSGTDPITGLVLCPICRSQDAQPRKEHAQP
jgi:hypothetical protein